MTDVPGLVDAEADEVRNSDPFVTHLDHERSTTPSAV